jgi:predicted small lipoprotein YifL
MFADSRRSRSARSIVLMLVLGLLVALAGCGKKGPLIPPNGDQPPARQAPPTPVR